MADVVVVGGGIGGMVLARRLALGGVRVTLLEAGDRLGGCVSHHVVGGLVLDAGAESFATRGGTVAALAAELGLEREVVQPSPRGAWLLRPSGGFAAIPELTLLGIPGSPLSRDVVSIIGARAAFRALLELLVPGTFASKSATLGELVRKRMGRTVVDELVAPIASAVHSAHPDALDPDRVAPGLRTGLRRSGSLAHAVRELRTERAGGAVAGIRGGVHRLVDELEADLHRFGVDVRLGVRATTVRPGAVATATGELSGLVVAAASGLFGEPRASKRVVLATLVLDATPQLDAAPRGSGVLVASGAPGTRAHALTHSTAKWPWLAERAEGRHVVRLSYDGAEVAGEDAREAASAFSGAVSGRVAAGAGGPQTVDVAEAVADASYLLGTRLDSSAVVDFAVVEWSRPQGPVHAPDGISLVGEMAAGAGIANITSHAEAVAVNLLEDFAGGRDYSG